VLGKSAGRHLKLPHSVKIVPGRPGRGCKNTDRVGAIFTDNKRYYWGDSLLRDNLVVFFLSVPTKYWTWIALIGGCTVWNEVC